MNQAVEAIGSIIAAIVGLAIVSVILSKNSQTPQVLQAGGSALGGLITAAVSPITSGASQSGINLPSGYGG